MARYIDADKLTNEIDEWLDSVGNVLIGKGMSYYGELLGCIEDTPTADVVEVKHRKWEKRKTIIFDSVIVGYNCSECNTTWDTGTPYCPNCGAKMDDERKCNND